MISCSIEAQPRHGDWANGFSIDWIGLRPLLLPPRVRRMAEEGICSMHFIFNVFIINPLLTLGSFFPFILGRKDGLSEVWKVKKDDDIKDYCGACVKHCLPAEAENLGTAESRFDVFDCACFESGDLFFFCTFFISSFLIIRLQATASAQPFLRLQISRANSSSVLQSTPPPTPLCACSRIDPWQCSHAPTSPRLALHSLTLKCTSITAVQASMSIDLIFFFFFLLLFYHQLFLIIIIIIVVAVRLALV